MLKTDRVRQVAASALRLALTLREAEEIQWSPSPIPKPREDTTERTKGGAPSNPTLDVVLDERRMEVRAAVEEATRELEALAGALDAARARLERAVDRWNGDD